MALHLNAFIRHAASIRVRFTTAEALGIDAGTSGKPWLLEKFIIHSNCIADLWRLALDVFWYGETFSATYKNRAYTGIRTLDSPTLNESVSNWSFTWSTKTN